MTDEQVIKRKLLIDGDGTGDERRLNALQKSLKKLCSADERPEEIKDNLDRMLIQLSQCKFSIMKSRRVAAMNSLELENYKALSKKITQQIEDGKNKIVQTKKDLQQAKRIRKNKMEYNSLGKVINQQPDRKKSEMQLATLKKDLDAMQVSRGEAIARLRSRQKQFHCLVLMLHQLKTTLGESELPPQSPEQMEEDVVEVDLG